MKDAVCREFGLGEVGSKCARLPNGRSSEHDRDENSEYVEEFHVGDVVGRPGDQESSEAEHNGIEEEDDAL